MVFTCNLYFSQSILFGVHGINRKPYSSVAWNCYHFVAIAILHQSRPTDSTDINARLQLSDNSSIPPVHGGFLLVSCCILMNSYVITLHPINQSICYYSWGHDILLIFSGHCPNPSSQTNTKPKTGFPKPYCVNPCGLLGFWGFSF